MQSSMPTMHTMERATLELPSLPKVSRRGRPPALVSPDQLSVEETRDGCVVTLLVRGQLDAGSVLTFRDVVFSALGERPERLIVDLSELRDLDGAGISALVTVARVAEHVRTELCLAPSPRFRALLIETGLARLFYVAPPPLSLQLAA